MRYNCLACKQSLNGHDTKLLSKLPLYLQAGFPAYITHKSAVSKMLMDLMRPLKQNSVSSKRLAKILRELHTLRHHRLELQYLNAINSRKHDSSVQRFFNSSPEPFSEFGDKTRYAGFVPSATYLRTVYTAYIETLRPLIDKQMMLLDGAVLKGDLESVPVFTALYTLCNEYEEIRSQLLVPSKALTHLKLSFNELRSAYKLCGHQEPQLFFYG